MGTMILAEMEPGSFFWWIGRGPWSVVWTICAIAAFSLITGYIYEGWEGWGRTDTKGLCVVGSYGIIAFVIWPLLSISFLGCSGCGPWLDDEEQVNLIQVVAAKNLAKMEQPNSSPPVANVASVSDVSERMELFSREEGHQVTALIENLKAAEVNLQGNINEYKNTRKGLGRSTYYADGPIHKWELLARDMAVDRQKLEENLKQAFLWSEKFRLAPSAGHKAELAARVSEGNELVAEISSRYHELIKIKTTS
jgi:hypothetical protein